MIFLFVAVHWYVVCAIVAGCCAFLLGVSVCVYQCYRRRSVRLQSPDSRLSSAIRKGLMKEYQSGGGGGALVSSEHGSMTKSPSMRSTGSSHSAGSSGAGGHQRGDQSRGSGRTGAHPPPGSIGPGDLAETAPRYETVNETSLSPQEKGASSKEKAAENDGKAGGALGALHFSVQYAKDKAALVVSVTKATDLPVKDPNVKSSDPYVKLQLLPDKRQKVCEVLL